MNSGLDIGNSLTASVTTAFDPSAYMVFGVRDMAAFAEKAPLQGGARARDWTYTNGNTILLSRIIRDSTGGDAASVLAFARRELFDKLGMRHVTLEFDATGTPIGSSHMLASARDWARFGLLYLNDGVVGGERLLPPGWVDYSAAPTPGSEPTAMARASGPIAATAKASATASRRACRPTPSWPAAPTGNMSSSCPRSAWSWRASAAPSRRATTWMSWPAWWPT